MASSRHNGRKKPGGAIRGVKWKPAGTTCRVGPRVAARPLRFARPLSGQRCRGGRANAPGGTRSRTRCVAACGARHADEGRIAGFGIPGRGFAADAGRGRSTRRRHGHARSLRSTALSVPLLCRLPHRRCGGDLESLGPRARSSACWSLKRTARCASCSRASAVSASRFRNRAAGGGLCCKRRRPSILLRRKPGRRIDGARVHRGEREIIARN